MSTIVHERHLARGRKWKRRKDRRVLVEVMRAHDREMVTLRSRHGVARTISRLRVLEDFVEVAPCPTCGRHIGVKVPHGHTLS